MEKTSLSVVADLSCLRPSVKTSDWISGTLMSDMESPSTKLYKTLKPQFPSGNIDPRKVFETCYMFYDELFLEPTMS